MVTPRTQGARPSLRRAALASGCTLVLTGGVVAAPPAHAVDREITAEDQPYYSYYHLDTARAKGYTGAGVTIAIIDGPVDTSVPELVGANITDKSPCTIHATPDLTSHGTTIASMLVSNSYGIVPDATLLSYSVLDPTSHAETDCTAPSGFPTNHRLSDLSSLINHAINDGATVINLSSSTSSRSEDLKWAIARSMSQGVLITASAGNESRDENEDHLSWWSGVIGVSAIDTDGKFASYSSWGQGVTTAAIGGPIEFHDLATGTVRQNRGTSFSAPIVAGVLAQARAKWPDATPNQLLQLLINTAVGHEQGWNQYGGYGAANLGGMLNTDPGQYPDENPLADKGGGSSPTPAEVRQFADGLVDPTQIAYDNSYVYRGLDESQVTNKDNPYPTHLGTSPRFHGK